MSKEKSNKKIKFNSKEFFVIFDTEEFLLLSSTKDGKRKFCVLKTQIKKIKHGK